MKTFEPKSVEDISTEIRMICADLKLTESMFYKDGAYTVLNEYYVPILVSYVTQRAELAQVRKERDSANKLLEMAWASVNSSAKVCKNPTDIRLAKMIEAHLTPAAPDNIK